MSNNFLDDNSKSVFLRCVDHAEMAVFTKFDWGFESKNSNKRDINYEITIEDSYCGGDYMGIKGRFKRAWKAFWAKPLCYTGVYCEDKEKMKKFLNDCLELINEED